jgi:hypothetical protein
MKQIILFLALILMSVLARAEVFRCKTQDGVVYSEHPCANAKEVAAVSHLAKQPSVEDVRAAQSRLDSNILQVEENERQVRQERQEAQARELRQGTPGRVVVTTRSTSTTTQPFVPNQNIYVQRSPQTAIRSTGRAR